MASQKTKFMVGLFLAGGIGIAVIAFILLGMSRFLEKGSYYVTYFNESVQGLEIDSPVKYRGVPVGRVDRIAVAPDSKLIKVVLKIETGQALERDMVAQLKSVGITGAMFIELDRRKAGEPDRSPPLSFPSEYPIVGSRPSDMGQILQGIDEVVGKINRVDFEGIASKIKNNLDRIDHMVSEINMRGLSRSVETTLESLRRILQDEKWKSILASVEHASESLDALLARGSGAVSSAEKVIANVEGLLVEKNQAIRSILDDFGKAVQNANLLLERSQSMIAGTDDTMADLRRDLLLTVRNLAHASENLNRLIEVLLDQPSQLLLGDPPAPRKIDLDTGKKR
jgi:phospholipid/cholesterol/gamma-HCH transport system substrate-binding protein